MERVETTYLPIKRTLVKKQNHMHIIKFYDTLKKMKIDIYVAENRL